MYRTRSRSPESFSDRQSVRAPAPRPQPRPSRDSTNRRSRGYSLPRSQSPQENDHGRRRQSSRREVRMLLAIFHPSSHNWSTAPLNFYPGRTTDRALWSKIRSIYTTELRPPLRRLISFRHIRAIVPIAFSPNGVPSRTDPKDFPDSKQLRHAFHHPEFVKTEHYWVDYFASFDAGDERQNGLEFIEGLWADKLGLLAILASFGIIIACIIWCALGGQLQTVFTVMGFVLSFVAGKSLVCQANSLSFIKSLADMTTFAAEIALIALYFQVISNDQSSN